MAGPIPRMLDAMLLDKSPVKPRHLVAQVGHDPKYIQSLLKACEDNGLVECVDRTANLWILTKKGKAIARR